MNEYLASLVQSWLEAKVEEEVAKKRKDDLAAEIIAMGEDTKPFGVTVSTRSGSYSDKLVPILKEKGLRNAIKVTEKPDTSVVKTLIESGVLDAAVVAQFKSADSTFLRELKQNG